ncbi:transglutaminase family protein [uncultured Aquabacterium sp.]|jgi:transglutaminase-like putative cysteine protease|uniref:transglutaminase family protein n=1 Tax=uncultured Aquabacterium sp. TaxID=158753 RepID=UPI00261F30A3|nr:transglutaminase family protein [uncultured Aquabacterium sp.]
MTMARLSVEHETLYTYASPVEQAQHIACLRPLTDAGQTLEAFDMTVSPSPSQHSVHRDSHDNSRACFALHAPHSELRVVARSTVQVRDRYPGLNAADGPDCERVRSRLAYRAHRPFEPACEYVYASPYVPLHAELRDYASVSLQPGRPLAEAAIELMHRIHTEFTYAPASTDISTPILDVFDRRQGVCQDFAHLMIGCLRAWGVAARYVSGYLLTRPPPGQAPLVGADASHAWLSVWVPGLGPERAGDWLDLDPTNDCIPALHHVRVAHGRDFGDVTPLRGVIRGGGRHTLLVRVTTRLLDEYAELDAPRTASVR